MGERPFFHGQCCTGSAHAAVPGCEVSGESRKTSIDKESVDGEAELISEGIRRVPIPDSAITTPELLALAAARQEQVLAGLGGSA
jgi:hypothetical protein